MLPQLEAYYETRTRKAEEEPTQHLSPEVEKFLKDIDKRFS